MFDYEQELNVEMQTYTYIGSTIDSRFTLCVLHTVLSSKGPTNSPRVSIFYFFFLFSLAIGAGSPQQREPITVGPYYLSHPVDQLFCFFVLSLIVRERTHESKLKVVFIFYSHLPRSRKGQDVGALCHLLSVAIGNRILTYNAQPNKKPLIASEPKYIQVFPAQSVRRPLQKD